MALVKEHGQAAVIALSDRADVWPRLPLGSLMAGAMIGSLPLVILYAFFVEHYVSAMTGAVKE